MSKPDAPDETTLPLEGGGPLEIGPAGPLMLTDVADLTDNEVIAFQIDGAAETLMAMHSDGRIFIRGELVDDNHLVYEAFCEWLEVAVGHDPRKGRPDAEEGGD